VQRIQTPSQKRKLLRLKKRQLRQRQLRLQLLKKKLLKRLSQLMRLLLSQQLQLLQ
jgi:hypothetical protein